MPTQIIDPRNAEHYTWGGPGNTDCDAWYLLKAAGLNVIEELMPPGTGETRHLHRTARQFFYVLSGALTVEVEHHEFTLAAGQGIEVHPGQAHMALNRGPEPLRLLVTSQPPSHDDRVSA